MYNKKFIVMATNTGTPSGDWSVIDSTDDFQEAVRMHKITLSYFSLAMLVSPVKFKVLEEPIQLDMFEEAQA